MCGAVTSMPSLTRSGRPSFSFSSSPPCGSTSTALRVRSATLIVLRPYGLEILDLDRLDLVSGLEAEDLCEEREVSLQRALDVLRLAKPVALPGERDVRMGNPAARQRLDDHL